MSRAFLVLALTAALSAPAAAQTAPYDLYAAGKYEQAIAAGVAQNDAEVLQTAAHAAFAEALLGDKPCLRCLQRAEDLARRAIAADPANPVPHVYLAGILGYEGRIVGVISAKLKGYPEQAEQQIDAALAIDPNDARALAALGGWNIAIVSAGGATLARWFYGASVEHGLADFDRAFLLAPGDLSMRYQYALSLSGLDREKYRADILAALEKTQSDDAPTAYDKIVQSRALRLLNLLKADKSDEYDATVRAFQGYP